MLNYLFLGFCSIIVVFTVIPAIRSFYYMIRDVLWNRRNLPKK